VGGFSPEILSQERPGTQGTPSPMKSRSRCFLRSTWRAIAPKNTSPASSGVTAPVHRSVPALRAIMVVLRRSLTAWALCCLKCDLRREICMQGAWRRQKGRGGGVSTWLSLLLLLHVVLYNHVVKMRAGAVISAARRRINIRRGRRNSSSTVTVEYQRRRWN
jgi:hypothetical protein